MASHLADFQSMYGMYGRDEPGYATALEPSYNELLKEIRPMMSSFHKKWMDDQEEWRKMQLK
ncbi:MAG: hypothetical protein FWD31_08080 [Planctomycetaceae bacterium]|nr:hypothetical protein [Planctomycetaceae bacterium]